MPSSPEWHGCDGRFGRPKPALLRGARACGWRGAAEYPLDRTVLDDNKPLHEARIHS